MAKIIIEIELANDRRKSLPDEFREWITEGYAGAYGDSDVISVSAKWVNATER